jgi:hypothetical protein
MLKELEQLSSIFDISIASIVTIWASFSHVHPLRTIYQVQLGQIMAEEPSPSRVKFWSQKDITAFDPLDAIPQLSHMSITCPSCRKLVDCGNFLI